MASVSPFWVANYIMLPMSAYLPIVLLGGGGKAMLCGYLVDDK